MLLNNVNKIFFFNSFTEAHYGYLGRITSVLSGPVIFFFMVNYISLKTQGYLSTFQSLMGLSLFFELGLLQIIITFVSHEAKYLHFKNNFIGGKTENLFYLKNIFKFCIKWFGYSAAGLLTLSIIIGFLIFFDKNENNLYWFLPWLVFVLVISFELFLSMLLSVLEGLGKVKTVYKTRFIKVFSFVFLFCLFLFQGLDIWSFTIAYAISLITFIISLSKFKNIFFQLSRNIPAEFPHSFNWFEEMFPLQIKVAISAVSAFFAFNIITPLTFVILGAETAGQMGVTLSMIFAILSLSTVLVSTNFHNLGLLASQKKFKEMDNLVIRLTFVILLLSFASLIIVFIFYEFLGIYFPDVLDRLLPLNITMILMMGMIISNLGSAMGAYLRAHKIDPVMWISITAAISIFISTIISLNFLNLIWMSSFYALISIIALPAIFLIFYFERKKRYFS